MNLLLLSNSTMKGEAYFTWALPHVRDFLPALGEDILFIPYAAVGFSYDDYTDQVNQALSQINLQVKGIHQFSHAQEALDKAQAILVGGGNTWQLLYLLQQQQLIKTIRQKVSQDIPYVGWSAGSNVACATIMTTNDMPVVQPGSFQALHLVPFQINPHYTEALIPGHGGESRRQRIQEYIVLNKAYVVGLPEGSLLRIHGKSVVLAGRDAFLFRQGDEVQNIASGTQLDFLMQ